MFVDNETIRVTKDGVWLSNGEPITHARTLEAYNRYLGRDEEGYFIEIGNNFKRIEVEDTPYFVRLAWRDPNGSLHGMLTNGTEISIDPSHLRLKGQRLTLPIFDEKEEAKFLPQAYHWILMNLNEGDLVKLGNESSPSDLAT
jgi:hypothetical protein